MPSPDVDAALMRDHFYTRVRGTLAEIESQGLTKLERPLVSPQAAEIRVATPTGEVSAINFCANNYLGLADDPTLVTAASEAMAASSSR
jgi:glycine C-acetyltransferase